MTMTVTKAVIAGVVALVASLATSVQSKPLFRDVDPASEDFALAEQKANELLEILNSSSPPLERITRYRMVRFDADSVRELFDQLANSSGVTEEDRQSSIEPRTELNGSFEIELLPGAECVVKTVTEARYLDFVAVTPSGAQRDEGGAWIYVCECEGRPLWAVRAALRRPDGWIRFDLRQYYRGETDSISSLFHGPVITLQALLGTSYALVFEEDRGESFILVERPE